MACKVYIRKILGWVEYLVVLFLYAVEGAKEAALGDYFQRVSNTWVWSSVFISDAFVDDNTLVNWF